MKGTNYIDHRLSCKDMVRSVIATSKGIELLDMYRRLLYIWIED